MFCLPSVDQLREHQWRRQPDNFICYANSKLLPLFISLEIDCFHSQWAWKYLLSGTKSSEWLRYILESIILSYSPIWVHVIDFSSSYLAVTVPIIWNLHAQISLYVPKISGCLDIQGARYGVLEFIRIYTTNLIVNFLGFVPCPETLNPEKFVGTSYPRKHLNPEKTLV
jgi:hypothetical protein